MREGIEGSMYDFERKEEVKRAKALVEQVKVREKNKVSVRVNHKTILLIHKDKDKEEAVEKHKKAVKNSRRYRFYWWE